MLKLGHVQKLPIIKIGAGYAILGEKGDKSLEGNATLPKRFVTDGMKVGDLLEVFVYRDDDKILATTKRPRLRIGEVGFLKVIEITKFGAFLDNGIEKDLFLPHKEQISELRNGGDYMVSMYVDKTGRLCATMNVYDALSTNSSYKVGDKVNGTVFSLRRGLGAMIAVDGKYLGMILEKAIRGYLHIGEKLELQVTQIRDDGKLLLVQASQTKFKVDTQCERVYDKLVKNGGFLPYNDKSSPAKIYDAFHLSKSDFKKSIGSLFKKRMIIITRSGIELAGRENPKTEYRNKKHEEQARNNSSDKKYSKNGSNKYSKNNDKRYSKNDDKRYSKNDDKRYSKNDDKRYSKNDDKRYSKNDDKRYSKNDDKRYSKNDDKRYSKNDDKRYSKNDDKRYSKNDDKRYSKNDDKRYSKNDNKSYGKKTSFGNKRVANKSAARRPNKSR